MLWRWSSGKRLGHVQSIDVDAASVMYQKLISRFARTNCTLVGFIGNADEKLFSGCTRADG
jgi:hypothetical protein